MITILIKELLELKEAVETCRVCPMRHDDECKGGFCSIEKPVTDEDVLRLIDELIFYRQCMHMHNVTHLFEKGDEPDERNKAGWSRS